MSTTLKKPCNNLITSLKLRGRKKEKVLNLSQSEAMNHTPKETTEGKSHA